MYHGYHFVYLVLFLFIFYGIFVKKTLPEDKKEEDIFQSLHKLFKNMSLIISQVVLFIVRIRNTLKNFPQSLSSFEEPQIQKKALVTQPISRYIIN